VIERYSGADERAGVEALAKLVGPPLDQLTVAPVEELFLVAALGAARRI
jgi:hypothetical protein